MKIHFIISSLQGGGAERVLTNVVNSLCKNKRFEISVITLFDKGVKYKLEPEVNIIRLKGNKFLPSHTLRSIINLSRLYLAKENRPDLIVSFITLTNQISIIVAKLFSIKIIVQEHNSHLRYMKGRKISTYLTKRFIYPKAEVVTVLTSFDINYYKNYGVNVKVLPNPCSFVPISSNNHQRENIILAAGSLNRYHHKGFDNLINLIAPILKKHNNWRLDIAGPGEEGMIYLKKLVEENELKGKVNFMGYVGNISEVMYKASIFVLPSRFEGLPMVLLEAMSQGMACIAYDCVSGPSDIIENNINGLLIKDQNQKAMQKGLVDLINNENIRAKFGNAGIQSLEKFDIKNVTKIYEQLFKETINL